jgi:two-component system LytT family sensor kinase
LRAHFIEHQFIIVKKIIFICFILFITLNVFSNASTDSLYNEIQKIETKDSSYFQILDNYLENKNFNFNNVDFELINVGILQAKKQNNSLISAKMFNWLGSYHFQKSQIENAILNYQKAIKILEKSKHKNELLGFYTNLANSYNASSDFEKALEINLKTIQFIQNDPSSSTKARYYFYLAKTYDILHDFDNAIIQYLVAKKLAEENNFKIGVILSNASLGHIYNKQNKFKTALPLIKEALAFYRPNGSSINLAASYSELADSYFGLKEYNKAILYYDSTINTYTNIENITYLKYNYNQLAFCYTKVEKSERAYKSYQNAIIYADSIYKQDRVKAIEDVKIQYETEEHKQEKQLAEANELLANARAEKSKNTSFLIGIFSLLILGLLIYIFSRLKVIQSQKIQLDEAYLKLEESTKNELAVSNLKALKSQMNPHFIFNLLNSIQALVLKGDIDASYNYMTKFATLVRKTLHFSDSELVELEDEISLLKIYLDLEKLRFPKNFDYQIRDNNIEGVEIPPLLIQPFIENALVHGLLHKEGQKTLIISFEIKDKLICTITDNGIGRAKSKAIKERQKSNHQSFSTQAIEKRFKILSETYKGQFGFKYEDIFEGDVLIATQVKLSIPFKRIF